MLKEMSTHGLEPDCCTYGLLLDYLCKKGRCREARIFFDSMIRKGILLHGYATKGALSEMHSFLDLMVGNGVSPDHRIFNIMFCAYAKKAMIDEAMHIFNKMRQHGLSMQH